MKTVTAKQARAQFSKLLDQAANGTVVAVTRRDKIVAQIGPPAPSGTKRLPNLAAFRETIHLKGEPMSATVIRMRREERF